MKTFLVLLNQLDGSADASVRQMIGTKVVASYFTLEAHGALSFWYTAIKEIEGKIQPRDILVVLYAPNTWRTVKQIDDTEYPENFRRPEGSPEEVNSTIQPGESEL